MDDFLLLQGLLGLFIAIVFWFLRKEIKQPQYEVLKRAFRLLLELGFKCYSTLSLIPWLWWIVFTKGAFSNTLLQMLSTLGYPSFVRVIVLLTSLQTTRAVVNFCTWSSGL
ncbi:unnamed protein product [Musa banksii]